MPHFSRPALGAALAGLAVIAGPVLAQTPAPARQAPPAPKVLPAPPVAVDPKVQALLDQAVAAHKALTALSATITVTGTGGGPVSSASTVTLAFRQPNTAKATVTDASGPVTELVSDGKTLTTYSVRDKKYRTMPAPADASAITLVLGPSRSLIALLISRPTLLSDLLNQKGVTATLGAPKIVGGVSTETVTATLSNPRSPGAAQTVTLSLGASDHLLRRLAITLSAGAKTSTVTETVTALSAAPSLTAADFTFTPPAGATKDTAVAQEPAMHDPRLVPGAKPFAIAAKDLAGRPLSLSQYKGKVVLMDFWATWCGPCVGEMPNVIAAYKKYHAQGFDVVGVSLDQDKSALTGFIASNKMPWRQVFDGKGWGSAVPNQYGVRAIPFGLLIGRDGKIAAVDVRGPALTAAIEAALK